MATAMIEAHFLMTVQLLIDLLIHLVQHSAVLILLRKQPLLEYINN